MGPDVAHKLERFVCHRCNWWRIVALIEPNGDSPPSRRRMFALPLSGRNSKWSDPVFFFTFPSLHCQQLWPPPPIGATAAAEGRPDQLTVHFPPAVTPALAAKVWEVWLRRGHLMKRRDRWSGEWWRNERRRRTGCKNERVTFFLFFFLLRAGGGGVKIQTETQRKGEEAEGRWSITEMKLSVPLQEQQSCIKTHGRLINFVFKINANRII